MVLIELAEWDTSDILQKRIVCLVSQLLLSQRDVYDLAVLSWRTPILFVALGICMGYEQR
jgi:hypothetical protein